MPSGFEIMWVLVLFDLPRTSQAERKKAASFRNNLLDEGFIMKQFSVYMKHSKNRVSAEMLSNRIGKLVPQEGDISIMFLTDKQFSMTKNYAGSASKPTETAPKQLLLF